MKLILPLMGHPVQMVNTERRRERERRDLTRLISFVPMKIVASLALQKGVDTNLHYFLVLNFYYMQGPFFNREVGTEWQQEIDNIKQQEIIKTSISRLLEIFNWPFLKRGRKFPWNSFVNVAC